MKQHIYRRRNYSPVTNPISTPSEWLKKSFYSRKAFSVMRWVCKGRFLDLKIPSRNVHRFSGNTTVSILSVSLHLPSKNEFVTWMARVVQALQHFIIFEGTAIVSESPLHYLSIYAILAATIYRRSLHHDIMEITYFFLLRPWCNAIRARTLPA